MSEDGLYDRMSETDGLALPLKVAPATYATRNSALPDRMMPAARRASFRLANEHHRFMPVHPEGDEDRHIDVPVEPCELPDGIRLVYADDRDRRHTVALEDAALLDFGSVKAFRKPPAYRGQRNFPGFPPVQ
jgi:hypothetical protein